MYLGRGLGQTDDEILSEFHTFYQEYGAKHPNSVLARSCYAPQVMLRWIGAPIHTWTEDQVSTFVITYNQTHTARARPYVPFLAFLILRGYFCPSQTFLLRHHISFSRNFTDHFIPLRKRIQATCKELGIRTSQRHDAGREVNLLVALLVHADAPLERLPDDAFTAWYGAFRTAWVETRGRLTGRSNWVTFRAAAYHIKACLTAWGLLASPNRLTADQIRLQSIQSPALREGVERYIRWCAARLRGSGPKTAAYAATTFILWAQAYLRQECGQDFLRFDDISRDVAVAYVTYLRSRHSAYHSRGMAGAVRRFFEFAIDERLPTIPDRNPFSRKDMPDKSDQTVRYFDDAHLRAILAYCAEPGASLYHRTIVVTLLHTGIRASELATLRVSDIVQIQGVWKLHIHAGKGLKDRVIPLTAQCRQALSEWCETKGRKGEDYVFEYRGRPWRAATVERHMHTLAERVGVPAANPHRFRHTFAMSLLNYGMRETALQKLLGHETLNMTLEYAKILDRTVEQAFTDAVTQMREGPLSWIPSFFTQEDFTRFAEGDTLSWIRLPVGFCRRNPKLHCESDVKCFLCERFYLTPEHLPILHAMYERFAALELPLKAVVVQTWIERLERVAAGQGELALPNGNPPTGPMGSTATTSSTSSNGSSTFIPLQNIARAPVRQIQADVPPRMVSGPGEPVGAAR